MSENVVLKSNKSLILHKKGHRVDIDGLRGLAIVLVVFFHVFVGKVSSGVDVFLLLGGIFFFSSQINNAYNPKGLTTIQSAIRIVRRLYPALVVVVISCLGIGFWVYSSAVWYALTRDSAAALSYSINWVLISTGREYAAAGDSVSIFQHLWSMAAQMQIYIGSLIFIGVVAWLVISVVPASKRVTVGKFVSYGFLVVFTVISFVYACFMVEYDQQVNYYSSFTRFWEIGLGGLFGIFLVKVNVHKYLRFVFGFVGLSLIVGTGIFFDGGSQFPGPLTLIPLLGAILVVLAGQGGQGAPVGVTKFLESKQLQFFGKISYSLYLWHWPLLILISKYAGSKPHDIFIGSVVILTSVSMAWLTYSYIETPLRQKNKPLRANVFLPKYWIRNSVWKTAVSGLILVMTTSVFVSPMFIRDMQEIAPETVIADYEEKIDLYPGAKSLLYNTPVPSGNPIIPEMSSVNHMLPPTQRDGCFTRFDYIDVVTTHGFNTTDIPCWYGDLESDKTLYILGGSHSEQYLPPLEVIGARRGFKVMPLVKMGCPVDVSLMQWSGMDSYELCSQWSKDVKEYIKDNPPTEGIFMISTRPKYLAGMGPDQVPEEYVKLVQEFTDQNIHTWGMRDNPWITDDNGLARDVRVCIAEGGDEIDCGVSLEHALSATNPALYAYQGLNYTNVDLTDAFCVDGYCPAIIGNILVYRDTHHFTNIYSLTLADELEERMFADKPIELLPATPS